MDPLTLSLIGMGMGAAGTGFSLFGQSKARKEAARAERQRRREEAYMRLMAAVQGSAMPQPGQPIQKPQVDWGQAVSGVGQIVSGAGALGMQQQAAKQTQANFEAQMQQQRALAGQSNTLQRDLSAQQAALQMRQMQTPRPMNATEQALTEAQIGKINAETAIVGQPKPIDPLERTLTQSQIDVNNARASQLQNPQLKTKAPPFSELWSQAAGYTDIPGELLPVLAAKPDMSVDMLNQWKDQGFIKPVPVETQAEARRLLKEQYGYTFPEPSVPVRPTGTPAIGRFSGSYVPAVR